MDRARVKRWTLPDNAPVPGTQVYSDSEGRLWHDLRHVHVALCCSGYTQRWKFSRRDVSHMWLEAGVGKDHYFIEQACGTHVSHICSTFALIMALWMFVTRSRWQQWGGLANSASNRLASW